jgi:hypothetical protein
MVTSGFVEFEADAYGELVKPRHCLRVVSELSRVAKASIIGGIGHRRARD